MEIGIDLDSAVPIYSQIVHSIKHQVATGQLKPGEQLPTVRELATISASIRTQWLGLMTCSIRRYHHHATRRGTHVREHPNNVHLTRCGRNSSKQ
jgi:DNA-binding transcriptional MocR family regulator